MSTAYTHRSDGVDLARTGISAAPTLLDMHVSARQGDEYALLHIEATLPGGHSSAQYELTPDEMRALAEQLLHAAERVSKAQMARAFERAYIISAPGVTPYTTMAKSSCTAIMAAQARHGVHTVTARPA